MSNEPDSTESAKSGDPEGTVVLTRRRLDWLFLGAAAVAAIAGVAEAFATNELRPLLMPLGIVPLWLMERFWLPKAGRRVPRLSAQPETLAMLGWGAFMVSLSVGLFIADSLITGQRFNDPLKPYHYAIFVPFIIVMIVGTGLIEKRYRKPRDGNGPK